MFLIIDEEQNLLLINTRVSYSTKEYIGQGSSAKEGLYLRDTCKPDKNHYRWKTCEVVVGCFVRDERTLV